jgi:predicted phosphohydrolase
MRVFGISDLHLSFSNPKPMEVFGRHWKAHEKKIKANWQSAVDDSDIVLIPGDISWAMNYDNGASLDIAFLDELPGTKIIVKGNHDFWWKSVSQLRSQTRENIHFIQNDIVELGNVVVTGTRLWNYPFIKWDALVENHEMEVRKIDNANQGGRESSYDHEKIRNREIGRLKSCLAQIPESSGCRRIVLTHFPPIGPDSEANMITELLSEYHIDICVFGHLHNIPRERIVDAEIDGVRFVFVSCDYLDFAPRLILEV